jgi:hypothetical protein
MFNSNASSAGAGGVNYIEDVFSTWLYSGVGAGTAQTITNGIDLSAKGGLVWIKERTSGSYNHILSDTVRGGNRYLRSNTTGAQSTDGSLITSFNTTGFSLEVDASWNGSSSQNYVSWTFREQPKFFDVVTYTGTGSAQNIAHNLGSVPGCIIVKGTTNTFGWYVYHRSLTNTETLLLNSTDAKADAGAALWNSTTPTSTQFSLGNGAGVNQSGQTYVAYLFAHNAGGFGLTGTDNVISCGSFTTDGSGNATVNLGYEPQWVMFKRSDSTGSWAMFDSMRGMTVNTTNGDAILFANLADAESTVDWIQPTATGFNPFNIATSATYIYIAIRRGPMKVPTDGTKVYNATTGPAYGSPETVSVGFPSDLAVINNRSAVTGHYFVDRLRGGAKYFTSTSTAAEADDGANKVTFDTQNSATVGGIFSAPYSGLFWFFRRAPGFFDEVCYTGDSAPARAVTHNLGVAPELIFFKLRNTGGNPWWTYAAPVGATKYLTLNTDAAPVTLDIFANTAPTSSVFYVNGNYQINFTSTVVAYLFATCPGVSKVGTYTGTATTQTINCGFTGGARFVLIKRTDDTGDWYVWDSARGIVSGDDPYILLNSTAIEVTGTDYVDTAASGFELTATAPAAINASGGTYIFLAIA